MQITSDMDSASDRVKIENVNDRFNVWNHCLSVATFKKYLKTHLLDLAFPPIDTVTPHGLFMLRNCVLDFAVEHWFGCRATEPGFAGDIGAIEVWLIDWLSDTVSFGLRDHHLLLCPQMKQVWKSFR